MAMMFAFNALNTRLLARLGGDGAATELASAGLVGVEVSLQPFGPSHSAAFA